MKKLKQTLGKEETKKSKNINLSYTMLPGKKSRYDNNPAFLCVKIFFYLEISRQISNLVRSRELDYCYCGKLFQE